MNSPPSSNTSLRSLQIRILLLTYFSYFFYYFGRKYFGIELGQILIVGSALLPGLALKKLTKSATLAPAPTYAAYAADLLSATWFWSRLPL
jgi:sugar phosphate permease